VTYEPTFDLESYSEAGFVWTGPSEKYPLGRWVPPEGAKTAGIAAVGSAVYAEHPTTELLTASYDLCDGKGVRRWQPGQPMPVDLQLHLLVGGTLEFHKADFEVGMWAAQLVAKHGWMPLPEGAARCSMAKAHVDQYPGALDNLGAVLGIETEKDKDGKRLINKFCIPQQPIPGLVDKRTGKVKREPVPARRIYPHDDPEDFERLCAYCDTDVISQMQASAAMPALEPHEIVAWQLDQEMNHRGLAVDREGVHACIEILRQVLDQYGSECRAITGFEATQLEKIKGWLGAYGVHTASLDADAIDGLLKRDDIPPPARRVLELRALTGSASVKKLFQMANQLCADDRLRHLVIHHGTRPGRPTGSGPQPLNLPKAGPQLGWCECGRPHKPLPICPWCGTVTAPGAKAAWKPAMVDHVLEIMSLGSLRMVEQFFGDAMLAISGCLRGLFVAGPGYELVSTDYSSLQAVVAACLAGEDWKVEAFRERKPIYLETASKITGKSVAEYEAYAAQHGSHHSDRQAGKTAELACLSPETQVLTDRGYVAIVDVLNSDRLWDGEEWVTHRGLIDKGVRSVVSLDGVRMTPDHLVRWGLSWQPEKP
jgi:DNA polymerase